MDRRELVPGGECGRHNTTQRMMGRPVALKLMLMYHIHI